MTDTTQQFLQHWLDSDEAEAPVLLTGADEARLKNAAEKMAEREDVEVVRMADEKPTISINEWRGVFYNIARTTLRSKRLIIIPAPERLSLPAGNALLKALEESTAANRFLLTSTNPGRLLPTIRSRCLLVWMASAASKETGDEIGRLAADLSERLSRHGPSRELRLAFMRLRDYYCIKSLRGNEKLAREVLFASLPHNAT